MVALPQRMNNRRLDVLIRQLSVEVEGELGFWQFTYDQRQLTVITDEPHDRMRVMTPVTTEGELTSDECKLLLEANFDRALDAKYALSRGYLWAVFVHPLSDLSDPLFHDAVEQVKNLADNFRTSYSSTDLVFGGE